MVNFGPLAAEIGWRVWGPQQISTGFASSIRYCSDIAQRKSNQTWHDVRPSIIRRVTRNGITELSLFSTEGVTYIPRAAIALGISPHSSSH